MDTCSIFSSNLLHHSTNICWNILRLWELLTAYEQRIEGICAVVFFCTNLHDLWFKKLKTLNLQVFITLQNLRNHFSTISAKINWHTTSCKYCDCPGLTSVFLGSGLERIEDYAFSGCIKLLNVYCNAKSLPFVDLETFSYSSKQEASLHVPSESVDHYKNDYYWSQFGRIVAIWKLRTSEVRNVTIP